ncbi:MAG: glycerophosphodiester phosphodiesterase family protein [Anaerolineaceae bacterium]
MLAEKTPIPLIFAHRGASALAPENTLAAFRLARQLGADGIELDVMLSADDRLVVIHDDTVDRTTNGSGKVAGMPYAALRELDAGAHFGSAFRGEQLPTLTEVYEELGGKLLINVELKNYSHPFDALTRHVIALTERFNLQDSVLLSSFNPTNLSRARHINPKLQLGLLTSPGSRLMQGAVGRLFPYDALHPYHADVTEVMVARLHGIGKRVNTWTVDDPQALLRMYACGVDGVICNDPAAARKALEGEA